jgi:hypothetical protein
MMTRTKATKMVKIKKSIIELVTKSSDDWLGIPVLFSFFTART